MRELEVPVGGREVPVRELEVPLRELGVPVPELGVPVPELGERALAWLALPARGGAASACNGAVSLRQLRADDAGARLDARQHSAHCHRGGDEQGAQRHELGPHQVRNGDHAELHL